MTPSSSLAALFAALAQSGYSKATQSRATKHGVGLGGKPRCDRAKQQNDPFVLRFQRCRRGSAAYSVRFLKQFRGHDPDCLRSEAVQRTRGVVNTSCGLQKAIEAVCQSL